MKFIGIGRDKESGEETRYELRVQKKDISCLYKDRYGVYICTTGSKMMKVEHTLKELEKEMERTKPQS